MVSIGSAKVEDLLAGYREKVAKQAELRRKLAEISGTATASRNVVKVTVNGQGQVRSIEFPISAYKRTPPADLAKTIMETIEQARHQAMEAVRELMTPELPAGLNFMEMLEGKADAPGILPPKEPSIPDQVREYIGYKPGELSGDDTNE
jgi:DNA-binding protein YbaB